MRKLLNITKLSDLGWNYKIKLLEGLTLTINEFKKNINE